MSRVLKPTLSDARVGTKQEDYFCNKFKSPRLRPPSASALVLASARPPRSLQKAEPTTRAGNNSSEALQMQEHPGYKSTATTMTRVGCISQRVMKEEIETQRQLTRQAQKQLHVLHQTLSEKNKEIELVRRHLRAFENSAYCATGSSPRATSSLPVDSPRTGQPTEGSVISSSTAAVLAAGVQTGGTGARHRESIAAAATMIHNQGGPSSTAATSVARLKDQIQRQELYKKKLKQMLERLCRQLQFIQANLELLQHKQESTRKEFAFFQSRLAQERNHCLDLEHKKHELLEKQSSHAHNTMLVLDSLREEIASRTIMTQQRHEADRRRQDLLTLVAASPSLVRTMSIDKGLGAGDGSIKSSRSRKNSLHMLSGDKINGGFAPTHSSSDLATNRPHGSSHHRVNSIDLHHQAHHREAFMQVYEGQYARVLEETRESDLSVVLERFTSFQETKRHLLQIESDVAQRFDQLESEKEAHSDLVRKLRVSGLAEVEKRKKIRDFLEQLHHVKAVMKSQAKDKFVEQLKTLSFVQQGISNIVELLKCLDGRVPLPPLVLASPLDASSLEAASQGLLVMVHFCVQVVRHNPGAPIVFTAAQAEALPQVASGYSSPFLADKRSLDDRD
uniref:Uncharacterized protein n=1 Tax=Globisporangium ultimum (strain ATCC 200006 / CBS 805.95 / DAOM BR144) TaxID=431595 RepID=K3WDW7_GLOUD